VQGYYLGRPGVPWPAGEGHLIGTAARAPVISVAA